MRAHGSVPRKVRRTFVGLRLFLFTLAAIGLAGVAPPQGSGASAVLQLLRRGQVRLAHRQAIDQLTANPDEADLHALYGAVLEQMGHHSDANQAFEMASGGGWYESRGVGYHAAALARLGFPQEAIELRRGLELTGARQEGALLGMRLKQVEDSLAGGRPDLALELAEEMVDEFPSSPYAHAQLVEVLVAAGDVDLAGWYLIRTDMLGAAGTKRVRMARAHWLAAAGAYSSAWEVTEGLRMKNPHDADLWALRMRILRLWGRAYDAVMIAELDRFNSRRDPGFLVEAARCYEAAGKPSTARSLLAELQLRYAAHPHVVELDRELSVEP